GQRLGEAIERHRLDLLLLDDDHVVAAGQPLEVLHVWLVQARREGPGGLEEGRGPVPASDNGGVMLVLDGGCVVGLALLARGIVEADDLKLTGERRVVGLSTTPRADIQEYELPGGPAGHCAQGRAEPRTGIELGKCHEGNLTD